MPFKVVKEGQQALITNQQGNSRVVVGPRRVRVCVKPFVPENVCACVRACVRACVCVLIEHENCTVAGDTKDGATGQCMGVFQ